tara:strand:+ start:3663 stop:4229 length:567 start_codon:yes stop_codon:yes gene_type:complete
LDSLSQKQRKRTQYIRSKIAVKNRKKGLNMLLREISKPRGVMVEIGCWAGLSTITFVRRFEKVFAIDPWINGYDDENDKVSRGIPMNIIEDIFDHRMKPFDHMEKIKKMSLDAAPSFEDKSLDFVYIDACHQYESVLSDINAWLPKIKPGRFIGGHDYSWTGVAKAVDEVFGKPDKTFRDTSWLKEVV